MFDFLTKYWRKPAIKPHTEHVRIGRLTVHHILCEICLKPLLDGDVVTWTETEDKSWVSRSSHALCVYSQEDLTKLFPTLMTPET